MCWFSFCELLKEYLQQCLIPESLEMFQKSQWDQKKEEKKIALKCHNIKQVSIRVSNW